MGTMTNLSLLGWLTVLCSLFNVVDAALQLNRIDRNAHVSKLHVVDCYGYNSGTAGLSGAPLSQHTGGAGKEVLWLDEKVARPCIFKIEIVANSTSLNLGNSAGMTSLMVGTKVVAVDGDNNLLFSGASSSKGMVAACATMTDPAQAAHRNKLGATFGGSGYVGHCSMLVSAGQGGESAADTGAAGAKTICHASNGKIINGTVSVIEVNPVANASGNFAGANSMLGNGVAVDGTNNVSYMALIIGNSAGDHQKNYITWTMRKASGVSDPPHASGASHNFLITGATNTTASAGFFTAAGTANAVNDGDRDKHFGRIYFGKRASMNSTQLEAVIQINDKANNFVGGVNATSSDKDALNFYEPFKIAADGTFCSVKLTPKSSGWDVDRDIWIGLGGAGTAAHTVAYHGWTIVPKETFPDASTTPVFVSIYNSGVHCDAAGFLYICDWENPTPATTGCFAINKDITSSAPSESISGTANDLVVKINGDAADLIVNHDGITSGTPKVASAKKIRFQVDFHADAEAGSDTDGSIYIGNPLAIPGSARAQGSDLIVKKYGTLRNDERYATVPVWAKAAANAGLYNTSYRPHAFADHFTKLGQNSNETIYEYDYKMNYTALASTVNISNYDADENKLPLYVQKTADNVYVTQVRKIEVQPTNNDAATQGLIADPAVVAFISSGGNVNAKTNRWGGAKGLNAQYQFTQAGDKDFTVKENFIPVANVNMGAFKIAASKNNTHVVNGDIVQFGLNSGNFNVMASNSCRAGSSLDANTRFVWLKNTMPIGGTQTIDATASTNSACQALEPASGTTPFSDQADRCTSHLAIGNVTDLYEGTYDVYYKKKTPGTPFFYPRKQTSFTVSAAGACIAGDADKVKFKFDGAIGVVKPTEACQGCTGNTSYSFQIQGNSTQGLIVEVKAGSAGCQLSTYDTTQGSIYAIQVYLVKCTNPDCSQPSAFPDNLFPNAFKGQGNSSALCALTGATGANLVDDSASNKILVKVEGDPLSKCLNYYGAGKYKLWMSRNGNKAPAAQAQILEVSNSNAYAKTLVTSFVPFKMGSAAFTAGGEYQYDPLEMAYNKVIVDKAKAGGNNQTENQSGDLSFTISATLGSGDRYYIQPEYTIGTLKILTKKDPNNVKYANGDANGLAAVGKAKESVATTVVWSQDATYSEILGGVKLPPVAGVKLHLWLMKANTGIFVKQDKTYELPAISVADITPTDMQLVSKITAANAIDVNSSGATLGSIAAQGVQTTSSYTSQAVTACFAPIYTNPFFYADTLMLPLWTAGGWSDGNSSCATIAAQNNSSDQTIAVKLPYPGDYNIYARLKNVAEDKYLTYNATKQTGAAVGTAGVVTVKWARDNTANAATFITTHTGCKVTGGSTTGTDDAACTKTLPLANTQKTVWLDSLHGIAADKTQQGIPLHDVEVEFTDLGTVAASMTTASYYWWKGTTTSSNKADKECHCGYSDAFCSSLVMFSTSSQQSFAGNSEGNTEGRFATYPVSTYDPAASGSNAHCGAKGVKQTFKFGQDGTYTLCRSYASGKRGYPVKKTGNGAAIQITLTNETAPSSGDTPQATTKLSPGSALTTSTVFAVVIALIALIL